MQLYFKQNYPRSLGIPLSCTSDQEQSGAICYPKCLQGYYGLGPVCWHKCNGEFIFDCWIYCVKNEGFCPKSLIKLVTITLVPRFLLTRENKC